MEKAPALKVDRQVNLTLDFVVNTDGLNHGVMDGIPYLPPLVPSLHTLLTIGQDLVNNTAVYGPQSLVSIFDLDQVVELVINNLDGGPHPCKNCISITGPFFLYSHSFH